MSRSHEEGCIEPLDTTDQPPRGLPRQRQGQCRCWLPLSTLTFFGIVISNPVGLLDPDPVLAPAAEPEEEEPEGESGRFLFVPPPDEPEEEPEGESGRFLLAPPPLAPRPWMWGGGAGWLGIVWS